MDWIRVDGNLAGHPKILHLAELLSVPIPMAVGYVVMLWGWAVQYAPEGGPVTPAVCSVCARGGYGDKRVTTRVARLHAALVTAGVIDPDGMLHDWHVYQGAIVEKRERDREHAKKARDRRATIARATPEDRATVATHETRRDETIRDETEERARARTTQEPEFPPDDNDAEATPSFDAWFADYVRKERREEARAVWDQLTPEEQKKALATVGPWWAWKQPTTEQKYWPLPENWLKKKRFNDEIPLPTEGLCTRCGREPRLPGSETGRACWAEMGLTVPWTIEDEREFGGREHWSEYINAHKDLPAPWPKYVPWLSEHIKVATAAAASPIDRTTTSAPHGGEDAATHAASR